ncbi:outer membrane protein [Bradyrhizobium sp.]|uniref:outer membrane protein n=1 Tax=Bradyrhizobium sp. TaxID=376 RepID=UPI003BB094FB
MKKFWLSTVGLVALGIAAPASAADLAARPYTKAPPAPVVAIYDWTGFYIGANGGWGQARNCWDFLTVAGAVLTDGCREASGGLVGGQIGYRWQTGSWVWGVEGQGDWADLRASRVSLLNPLVSETAKVDGIGLITGQIGYAWNAALLYFKGGAAVTSNPFDVFSTLTGVGLASVSSTRWGGTVGVGFEYGFAPNWSVGLEYDHLFMGHANNSFSVVNPVVAGALNRISEDVDMVTVRFNYRFGGYGAPIAARY